VSKAGRTIAFRFLTCCVALLCWASPNGGPVFAAQTDFGGGLSLTHESNITKTPDPQSEWTEQLFAGLAYEERSPELTARAQAQVERRHFVRNVYPDDTGLFFDGWGVWSISPRFFTWTLQDIFRELNTSPIASATPGTLERTNSLSTGPEFTFRVNPTNTPVIGARYGQFRILGNQSGLQSQGDSSRITGYAQWLHQMSASSALSPNLVATRINFEPPAVYTTVTREDFYFRYDFVQPDTRQTVDVGRTRVVQYGGQEYSGRLLRYMGQWARTTNSALRILLADQISDTYSDTILDQDFSISTLPMIREEGAAAPLGGSNFAVPDIYHSQRGEFGYWSQGEHLGYSLQGNLRRVDYANLNQDYDEKRGRISLSWLVSIEAQAYTFMQYIRRVFPDLDQQDTGREMAVGMVYKLGRTLSLRLEAGRQERQSSAPGLGFVDQRAVLVLGYSTGPLYLPQSRR